MGTVRHEKLVRDRIPEIIESAGKTPVTRILTEEEMRDALFRKLLEEADEFLEAKNAEELADVLEVLHGLADAYGISWEDAERERRDKRLKRGAFSKRIYLVEVQD